MIISLDEFLEKYPAIKHHPNFQLIKRDDYYKMSIFKHELCHFVEREIDKACLKDFGFPKTFGEQFSAPGEKHPIHHYKREYRVQALEIVTPVEMKNALPSNLNIGISDSVVRNALKDYQKEQKKIYTEEIWWNNFHERYELLKQQSLTIA